MYKKKKYIYIYIYIKKEICKEFNNEFINNKYYIRLILLSYEKNMIIKC